MKRFSFMAGICASALTIASISSAVQAAERDRPSFGMLDRDGSGEITQSELKAMGQSRFDARDSNGDGVLDQAELLAAAAQRSEARVDRMMERLDTNDDGSISLEEMEARRNMDRVFARMDTDGSGGLSEAEFEEGKERMKQRMKERRIQQIENR